MYSSYRQREVKTLSHAYRAILDLSKKDLISKIYGLAKASRPGAFSLSYIDTDSLTVGYFDNGAGIASIAANAAVWSKFKVVFVSNPLRCKTLGLLKVENKTTDGHFVAARPKQYIMTSDKQVTKQASVGLKFFKLRFEDFIKAIYCNKSVATTQVKRFTSNNVTQYKKVESKYLQ